MMQLRAGPHQNTILGYAASPFTITQGPYTMPNQPELHCVSRLYMQTKLQNSFQVAGANVVSVPQSHWHHV